MNQNLLNSFLVFAMMSLSVPALSFDYFDRKFDYFSESTSKPKKSRNNSQTKSKSENKFDWKMTLDPMDESMEFFKEGDHIPPRPYIEMLRNPNDENISNWFKLMKMKNDLSQALAGKIREFLKRNPNMANISEFNRLATPKAAPTNLDPKRYRLRLYFHSKCTHCQKMLTTMKRLADNGLYVEVRQIDGDQKARANIPFPVKQVTKNELEEKQIASWPVLLAADLKTKKIYRINGYQPAARVIETLSGK